MLSKLSFIPLYIESYYNDRKLASGTASIFHSSSGERYLITNRHNFTGRHNETNECFSDTLAVPNKIKVHFFIKSKLTQDVTKGNFNFSEKELDSEALNSFYNRVTYFLDLINEDDEPLWYEHPTLKQSADLAALKIDFWEDVFTYSYNIAESAPIILGVTENVSVVGYPFGKSNQNFPIWATGTIASDPVLNYNELPVMLVDCRTREGQSGSPVFAYRSSGFASFDNGSLMNAHEGLSRFIGIYSGRINKNSDIGLVWKSEVILELINSLP